MKDTINFPIAGAKIWTDADAAAQFPKRKADSHKGNFGTAAILAGWQSGGAGSLAVGACLKSGAGYTRHFVPEELYGYFFAKQPAAILQKLTSLEEVLPADAIAIGMGTGGKRGTVSPRPNPSRKVYGHARTRCRRAQLACRIRR